MRELSISFVMLALLTGWSFCRQASGPPLPSFNLLLPDSSTMLSSEKIPEGRPVVLMYFSPDCEHCQAETVSLLAAMDSLRSVRFYFITIDPLERLRVFRDYYRIGRFPNITLGRDYTYAFVNQMRPTGTPYLLVYNRHKRLRAVCQGVTDASKMINLTQSS